MWSKKEEDYLVENKENMTYREIAEEIGRTRGAIQQKAMRMGISCKQEKRTPDSYSQWTEEEIEYLKEHYDDKTYKEIGEEIGRTASAVNGKAQGIGVAQEGTYTLEKGEAAFNHIFYEYQARANRKDVEFDLSKEEFRELLKSDCHYCGTSPSSEMSADRWNGTFTYNGIDRLNSSKGYTKSNSVPACKKCNFMKRDMGVEDFLNKVQEIAFNQTFSVTDGDYMTEDDLKKRAEELNSYAEDQE